MIYIFDLFHLVHKIATVMLQSTLTIQLNVTVYRFRRCKTSFFKK